MRFTLSAEGPPPPLAENPPRFSAGGPQPPSDTDPRRKAEDDKYENSHKTVMPADTRADHGPGSLFRRFRETAVIPDAASAAIIGRESGPEAIATAASPGFAANCMRF